ncbi:MAG: hypothetical protein HOP07_10355 [Bacteriovoracaceae bacterium]|nr:hypothetical protein [Bacteriovoracaceae bacterium]
MELIGRVLWWSDRDENGIIVDPSGNEFYFDRSVIGLKANQVIERNSVVIFKYNHSVKDCLCACVVHLPVGSKKKAIEKQYERESVTSN